jgi:glutamate synthase (NADPH/NADH)
LPQVFMPTDEATRNKAKCIMERVAAKLGHDSLTWRVVPTSNKTLGKSAVAVEPHIEQWFLSAHGLKDNLETEQQVGVLGGRGTEELVCGGIRGLGAHSRLGWQIKGYGS